MQLQFADQFFSTARERYQIRLKRLAGDKPPWTNDPQFRQWRFCNVHREHDKTTEWFRVNVREPADQISKGRVVGATVAFRWFNRIETGRIIQDYLVGPWDSKQVIELLQGVHPIVTGAYIIKGTDGYPKLQGVCKAIDEARPYLSKVYPQWGESLEQAWNDVKKINYLGGFMSYEVISDLRWTSVLRDAHDIMTWANAGPGCARGLSWVVDGTIEPQRFGTKEKDQKQMLPLMQELLAMSKDQMYWPQQWEPFEMREIEHWSCEFDKYSRAKSGQQMKRRFSC